MVKGLKRGFGFKSKFYCEGVDVENFIDFNHPNLRLCVSESGTG